LANKLQALLDVNGSLEYALTWKEWAMPAGPPICALRASGRRTSAKGFIGWPTPITNDSTGSQYAYSQGDHSKPILKLPGAVQTILKGWPTPCSQDGPKGGPGQGTDRLPGAVAQLKGWPTPDTNRRGGPQQPEKRKAGGHSVTLQDAVHALKGWATPASRDWRDGRAPEETMECNSRPLNEQAVQLCLNGTAPQPSSNAATASGASQLNPRFSLWLMGIRAEWDACAPTEMRFPRSSRPSSSKPPCPAAPERFDDGFSTAEEAAMQAQWTRFWAEHGLL
jgi:hypothetical protein